MRYDSWQDTDTVSITVSVYNVLKLTLPSRLTESYLVEEASN